MARIVNIDIAGASDRLIEQYSCQELTVKEFNTLMGECADEKGPEDGSVTLRGTFTYDDNQGITFTLRVDVHMSDGRTLAERMIKVCRFWRTPRGERMAREQGRAASDLAQQYREHALAALEAGL